MFLLKCYNKLYVKKDKCKVIKYFDLFLYLFLLQIFMLIVDWKEGKRVIKLIIY